MTLLPTIPPNYTIDIYELIINHDLDIIGSIKETLYSKKQPNKLSERQKELQKSDHLTW